MGSSNECKQEQYTKKAVHSAQQQVRRMKTVLEIEYGLRGGEAEFLQHRRNDHRPEAHRISRDDDECKLPGEGAADESVVEAG